MLLNNFLENHQTSHLINMTEKSKKEYVQLFEWLFEPDQSQKKKKLNVNSAFHFVNFALDYIEFFIH